MNAQVLCIGGSATEWQSRGRELEANGYVMVHALDGREAISLLKTCPVDVVCIDSQVMEKEDGAGTAAELKDVSPHVPIVLVQTGNDVPEHFEEHVDVVMDDSTFATAGLWLLEELREVRFPMFMEWFEAWKERSAVNGAEKAHAC